MFKKKVSLLEDAVMLGEKKAKIVKLTPAKFKELITATNAIPMFLLHALAAPRDSQETFVSYMTEVALSLFDDVVRIVAILSDIDEDYLKENAGINEIIDYLAKTLQKNNLNEVLKNVKSLLPKKPE
ncbi:MAG: hypothetical protein IRZ03_14515 [Acidobacterium ailaaui]|nr:hypothetical protein [Pseudacidobacterium ailaaui]